ncbi:MAG: hypothetical protein AMXMBFR58_18520 [Phycisphaerae bacterium]
MDHSVEHFYDEYLDAAMAGRVVPPDQFMRDRGVDDTALREVLEAVYNEYARATPGAPETAAGQAPQHAAKDVLGDFRLLTRLGEGGMGVVFLAEQVSLKRRVALKLLRPEIAASKAASTRFEREALAAARLNHPNIVSVIAVGEHRGTRYIAMEYVQGRGLDEILEQAAKEGVPIPIPTAVRWCEQIARALQAAHDQGIIHRDVKPSNIRITPSDDALLLDFGIARDLSSAAPTLTETFIGSPFYAAPEQVAASGGQVDARTDVYSAGLVLYECVTGRMPFAQGSLEQVLHAILMVEPEPPRRCGRTVPRDVDTVITRAIDKDPQRRYRSAGELADDLRAILELRPIHARPHGPVERVARWSRRNRPAAAAIATACAALLLGGSLVAAEGLSRRNRQREHADSLAAEASSLLDEYVASRERLHQQEADQGRLLAARGGQYLTPAEDAALKAADANVRLARRQREAMFYRVLALATQAERAGAPPRQAEELRARAYLQRYLEAETSNPIDAPMYRDLVLQHDPEGALLNALRGRTMLALHSDVPGARIDLFRREFESDLHAAGDRRLVLVPVNGWPDSVPVGAWGLRVVRGAGDLEPADHILELCSQPVRDSMFVLEVGAGLSRGDRLVSIDGEAVNDPYWTRERDSRPATGAEGHRYEFTTSAGPLVVHAASLQAAGVRVGDARALAELGGVNATVWKRGSVVETVLPPGLVVRATAAPALPGPHSLWECPPGGCAVEPGGYVALVTAPGYEPQRAVFNLGRGGRHEQAITLVPADTTLDGFVRIVDDRVPTFSIMEREVTLGEYFEFLNDPETLAEVDSSSERRYYPYNGEEALGQRDAQGRFLLPDGWQWDWPALHVSWHDARAYAHWRSRRQSATGRPVTFDLPTFDQWRVAARTISGVLYTFGDFFSSKWTSSCFSRPKPWPEPVMSFPIDETAAAVFDTAGSISEWTLSRWQEHNPHYRHAGGSWATGDHTQFGIYGGNGMLPERNAGFIGFRLVENGTTNP